MIKTIEVEQRLEGVMMTSRYLPSRRFLGMSQIYKAEADIVKEMRHGSPHYEDRQLLIYSLANDFERFILEKLEMAGVVIPKSSRALIADFDPRFRGHTNAEFVDGTLCIVKSTIEEKLVRIEHEKHIPNAHYVQAQMYMCHGEYKYAKVVYVARDTGRVLCRTVRYDATAAYNYNEKARRILEILDNYR